MHDNLPLISVVIVTFNRPILLQRALNSVLRQTYSSIEIVVVNDGSDLQYKDRYDEIKTRYADRVLFVDLMQRPDGHGPGFVRNTGALLSSGKYLGFLDDDDEWILDTHLENFVDILSKTGDSVSCYYAQQMAIASNGKPIRSSIWTENLISRVDEALSLNDYCYQVDARFMTHATSFAHLNVTLIERDFYLGLGGIDEALRYEEDKDFYFRCLDRASGIIFCCDIVSKHYVPDQLNQQSASRRMSAQGRLFNQTVSQIKLLMLLQDKQLKRMQFYLCLSTLKNVLIRHQGCCGRIQRWLMLSITCLIRVIGRLSLVKVV